MPSGSASAARWRVLTIVAGMPLLACCIFSLIAVFCRLWIGAPDNPWDAAGVVEADRLATGLALYQDPILGHATWLYGPGLLYIGAAMFRLAGPSTLALELASLAGIAGTIALGMAVIWRRNPPLWRMFAAMSFVVIEAKVTFFGVIRPDNVAMLLAFAALLLCYRGGTARCATAAALLCAAVLTKQTMLMFTVVPPIVWLIETRLRQPRRLIEATFPGFACLVMLIVVWRNFPQAWFYVITVPAQYLVRWADIPRGFYLLVKSVLPTLLVLGIALAAGRRQDGEQRRRMLWVGVSFAVALVGGTITSAKSGGSINSLIPAYFLGICLVWLVMAGPLGRGGKDRVAGALGVALLLALAVSFKPVPLAYVPIQLARQGARQQYREVVARATALPGRVVSPNDPTITLLARGQHDRSAVLDLDTAAWPRTIPAALLPAYEADFVIVKRGDFGVPELTLSRRGYAVAWSNPGYEMWRRSPGRPMSQRNGTVR